MLFEGDRVLVSQFGQFSKLWVQMCQDMKFAVHDISVEWGEATPLDRYREVLESDTSKMIKAVMVCQNETATGVTSDVGLVRELLDELDHPALLMVDGISSIGCIEYRHDDWRVDVAIAGSQKGFMMPTGLCIVGVSLKALEACSTSSFPTGYFSFQDMMKMNDQGYFPYTPAATLLRGLRASIDMLHSEGLANVASRHNRLASGVRAAVDAWGLKNCAVAPKWHSDTVTAIVVPEKFDANDVISAAYHNYGVSLGGGLGKVAGKVFRIGHLGWLNETMVLRALGGVEMAMRDAGIPFQAGSGVGAAVEYYTDTRQPLSLAAE